MGRAGILALTLSFVTALSASYPSNAGSVAISVVYQQRSCEQTAEIAPKLVSAGKLQVHFAGSKTVEEVDLGPGPVKVNLNDSEALSGTLILSTDRVVVVEGATSGTPQKIDLGRVTVKEGAAIFFVKSERDEVKPGDINHDEGHVNVLAKLEQAAELASQSSPVPLPKVIARVYDCSTMGLGSCPATGFFTQPEPTIQVGHTEGANSQWEANALAHEYGHLVMSVVAPGGRSGGDHSIQKSYPKEPYLAWTEGFAYAFSALVNKEGQGVLQTKCSPNMNLAAQPANPALESEDDEWFAQYSETRVAAVTYQLVEYLGGDVRGLKQLLTAMNAYERDKHSAWVARDLRDIAVNFETTGVDHAKIDRIFERQGITWSQGFSVSLLPGTYLGRASESEIMLRVTGPGGFDCHAQHDIIVALSNLDDGRPVMGESAAEGGLPYSKNDDCYLVSGDGQVPNGDDPHGLGNDVVTMPFPYLQGKAHWQDEFTVTARFACAYDQGMGTRWQFKCPETVAFKTLIMHFPLYSKKQPAVIWAPITLRKNQDVVIAKFSADGKCHAGDTLADCSF